MSQPWLKELNGDSMKVGYRGCFFIFTFYFMSEIPEPFFFSVSKFVLFTVEKVTIVSLFVL